MIYDISMLITKDIQVYKNLDHKKPTFKTTISHETHGVHETDVNINMHTGTHVDYPLHMIENGDTSNTEDLSKLITKAKVLDFTTLTDSITTKDLIPYDVQEDDFLLFKTKNSFKEEFIHDFVFLSQEASAYLANKKIKGVGTDGLGIERSQEGHPTHKNLLSKNIVIIEGLRLKDVPEGTYDLICLPLKIDNVEASLARAILVK